MSKEVINASKATLAKVTILNQSFSKVDELRKIYEIDPKAARVFAMQRDVSSGETVYFDNGGDNFTVAQHSYKYGVSVNLKLFSRKSKQRAFIAKDHKFYLSFNGKGLKSVYIQTLNEHEKQILYLKHPFLRFLLEHKIYIPLTTIFSKKIFNLKKALAYLYKCQYSMTLAQIHECGYLQIEHQFGGVTDNNAHKNKYIKTKLAQRFKNLHRANLDLFTNYGLDFIIDCSKMAESLDKFLDATWSVKRLKEEHDSMSTLVTNILYSVSNSKLQIAQPFLAINTLLPGEGLIVDTKGLALEGIKQSHCVATYEDQINRGTCAIYHIEGYTLQLTLDYLSNNKLRVGQFKGYKNKEAPRELYNKVNYLLNLFNHINNQKYEQQETNIEEAFQPFNEGLEKQVRDYAPDAGPIQRWL